MIEDNELNSTKNNYSPNVTSSSGGAIRISIGLNLNIFLNCESAPDAPDAPDSVSNAPDAPDSVSNVPDSLD